TDEWFTGGKEITEWAFGIVTRKRKPKKAFYTIQEKLGGNDSTSPHLPLPKAPFVSIIVCSYNGGHTLGACLDSLGKLNYPAYEVILVDDGSTDDTAHVAAQFPWVRYSHQSNHGLSYARNTGAAAAKCEVLAYTDSDCMADADWMYYLIGTLVSGDYAGVGGPNITPPAQNWIQACVAAAPGGPNHVLLTDTVAEHIPGCNMAFYRWAFEGVGGFDPEYRKAGDDVDFCWRIQQAGWVISFSPSAFVRGWGTDRTTIRHGARAPAGDAPRVCATARTRILSLFHLAAFQTHTGKRHSEARTFARTCALARQPESPRILERGGEGSPLFSGRNISVARRRRLALFRRQRLERLGHSNLRQFLVEHRASNRHRISRRRKMFDPCAAS